MQLIIILALVTAVIAGVGGAFWKGEELGRNACEAESARIADQYRAEVDAENAERRKTHAKRLKEHSAALAALAAERDKERDEQAAVLAEVEGRGASLAALRCARDADGMRRLYQAITGDSPVPEGLRDGAPGSPVDVPEAAPAGIPVVPGGVSGGVTFE